MKYALIILLTLGLMACSSSDDKDPNPNPNNPVDPIDPIDPEPELPLGYDPSYQKDYARLSDQGLPMGECVNVGDKLLWKGSMSHENMAPCNDQKAGQSCSREGQYCKIDNMSALHCAKETTYECHGWVVEKMPKEGGGVPDYKPLAGAEAYVFWFGGCVAGICDPQSEVVKSDENGYFKLSTTTLNDQVRVKKDGYYSMCNRNKPFPFLGAITKGKERPVTGGFSFLKLDADSCK